MTINTAFGWLNINRAEEWQAKGKVGVMIKNEILEKKKLARE